jgi:hypothetical protein
MHQFGAFDIIMHHSGALNIIEPGYGNIGGILLIGNIDFAPGELTREK